MPEVTEAKNASRTGLGEENGGGYVGDEFVIYRSAWTPMKRVGADESPVSSRFGHSTMENDGGMRKRQAAD
ncbi:hypothetical protein Dimus_018202 [Dionaea muscipula]